MIPSLAPRLQCAVNWDWNLKPKLAIMLQCTCHRSHKREHAKKRQVATVFSGSNTKQYLWIS